MTGDIHIFFFWKWAHWWRHRHRLDRFRFQNFPSPGLHCLPKSLLWDAWHKWEEYLMIILVQFFFFLHKNIIGTCFLMSTHNIRFNGEIEFYFTPALTLKAPCKIEIYNILFYSFFQRNMAWPFMWINCLFSLKKKIPKTSKNNKKQQQQQKKQKTKKKQKKKHTHTQKKPHCFRMLSAAVLIGSSSANGRKYFVLLL